MVVETASTENRRGLYPAIEPFQEAFLAVGDPKHNHRIHYEQSGNPDGLPVLVSHGGPGGGCEAYYRQYFDPNVYRIVMFDQRGAGKSTPHACLADNTTWHTVQDMEHIRRELGIDKWVLFGGSWGACISLTYAQRHPDRVLGLVLRGVFTLRRSELEWFYQKGSGGNENIFADAFDKFLQPIPEAEHGDVMSAYYRRLTGHDEEEKIKCAQAWSQYEMATSCLFVDPDKIARAADDDQFAIAFARIETHYFVHGGWFAKDSQLVDGGTILEAARIPGVIVQGRYDCVCPMRTAYDLHKNWPSSRLVVVPDAGHSCKEPGTVSELVNATDSLRYLADQK